MPQYLGANVVIPENDRWHREYLQQQASGRLTLQKCSNCGHLIYPVRAFCPDCRAQEYTWEPVSGKGTVHSYYVVPHAINPAFREHVPYVVALVELDEARNETGPNGEQRAIRMLTNIVDADGNPESRDNVAINKRVEVTMVDLGDGWALPKFRLSDEPPEGEPWQWTRPHE